MEIVVLGTGCAKCETVYERVKKVVEEKNIDATVRKEDDILEIVKYNIMALPAIAIDGEVKLKGFVPSEKEIIGIMNA